MAPCCPVYIMQVPHVFARLLPLYNWRWTLLRMRGLHCSLCDQQDVGLHANTCSMPLLTTAKAFV